MSNTKMKFNKLLVRLGLILVLATMAIPVILAGSAMAYSQYINIRPDHGPVGTKVYVYGESFTPSTNTTITFAKTYFLDKTTLVKTTAIDGWGNFETYFAVGEYPAGKHKVWVYDESASTPTWLSAIFIVEPQMKLSKPSGYVGDNITVSGTGFTDSSNVTIYFDDSEIATVTTTSTGSFTKADLTIPSSYNGSHIIKVVDASNNQRTGEFITKQQIIISPTSGPIGKEVTINGTGFSGGQPITISLDYNTVATIPASIRTSPTGNFTGKFYMPSYAVTTHIVEASDGSNKADTTFEVTFGGKLNRIVGYIGSDVTFTGAGFMPSSVTTIRYDDSPLAEATVGADGNLSVSFKIPASSSGEHTISVTDGTNTTQHTFTVFLVAYVEVNRNIGSVGSDVTFNGTGFVPGRLAAIRYDDIPVAEATIDANGNFTANFKIPASSSGEHTISITDGINTTQHIFTVSPAAHVEVNRNIGYIGSDATLGGVGFIPDRIITIYYDDIPVAEATIDANGNFTASFEIPASSGGEHTISTNDGINTANATFIMESMPPPVPVLLLPTNASEIETKTGFVWEDIADPSGVTYTLQIASDANFVSGNSTSLVLEKSGLTIAGYILAPEEELEPTKKGAPYYWRVRAIDNAFNIGDWSAVQKFYISNSWSPWFLYSLIAEGGIFTLLFGFWLVRRRS